MKETLISCFDIVLSRIGLMRSCHHASLWKGWNRTQLRVLRLRQYLRELRDATPHDNIKDEINEVLKNDDKMENLNE